MDFTIPAPAPVTEAQMSPEMTAGELGLCEFVEQEESSIMELPKRESSNWTDEKHSLYLKSMEASFVDQLNKLFDPCCWKTKNECSSGSMSSRRIHVRTRYSSRIQHFRNGNRYGAPESISPDEKTSSTPNSMQSSKSDLQLQCQQPNCSNAEVTDQNFVQEESMAQKVNTPYSKKRKNTSSFLDQAMVR